MGTVLSVEILAPTLLEYWAVRHTLPCAHTSWAGMHLAHWKSTRKGSCVIVCGLAGALVSSMPPGTVLIPEQIGLENGKRMHCDPALVQMLITAANTLCIQPDTRPLLTAQSLIVGTQRDTWARQGFVAADMETGLLAEQHLRVATIRVVLDSPEHTISADWLRPTRALRQPALWRELYWLSRVAPQYALRAAHVLKVGLHTASDHLFIE